MRLPIARAWVLRVLGALLVSQPLLAGPAEPRIKALIVDGQSNHGWRETTAALKATLLNTGRFTVDVSTAPPEGAPPDAWAGWQPAFADYDVVLTDYKGQMWPEGVRLSLESYVGGGGGFVIIHAPLSTFIAPNLLPGEVEWTAYSQMMALGWRPFLLGTRVTVDDATGDLNFIPPPFGGSANHGIQHSYVVKSRRPEHPIMAGVPIEWLHGKDELYHAMRGPAANLNVLASAFSAAGTGGTEQHEPMLWETSFGLGRIVTTVMGHRWFGSGHGPPGSVSENGPDALRCVGLQTLIARSAEWAAGRDVRVPVPDVFPSSSTTSIRDPLRGLWLKLVLKVNGQHPESNVVVTPGPLSLTLDMAPGLWAEPLDLYFGLIVGGNFIWITAGGPSPVPAPLATVTPASLAGLSLLNTELPQGALVTMVMFFSEGITPITSDLISAVVP